METTNTRHGAHSRTAMATIILTARYVATRLKESAAKNLDIMRRETSLFGGLGLFLIGICSFRAGRYCDGNTADYLSCTRPAVYYYYGVFEMFLIVVGAFFIVIWFLKSRSK